jgi:hypothetical protein
MEGSKAVVHVFSAEFLVAAEASIIIKPPEVLA